MKQTDDDRLLKILMSGKKPAPGPNLMMREAIERMHGKGPRVGTGLFVSLPKLSSQQAVVVNSRHTTGALNHARYIEREGVGENGERPIAFSHDQEEVRAASVVKDWEGDEIHYRRVLPLMHDDLDPKAYVRGYIAKLEKDWKTTVQYVASVHKNTAQTHVHVMIRGRDHLGRKLDVADAYAHQIEWRRASDVATELVGPRTIDQMAESILKEKERYERGISHPDLDLSGGWRLTVNVNRSRHDPATKMVMGYMREHSIRYDMNFATTKSEVLVANVGSYDRMIKAAKEIEDRVGQELQPLNNRYVLASGIILNDSMTAKFSPKGDRDFSPFTSKGVPLLKQHAREIKDLHIAQKMERAKDFREPADKLLVERYGEFYAGKERTQALERVHELKLEHSLGL